MSTKHIIYGALAIMSGLTLRTTYHIGYNNGQCDEKMQTVLKEQNKRWKRKQKQEEAWLKAWLKIPDDTTNIRDGR